MWVNPLNSNKVAIPFQKSKGQKWSSYSGNCWALYMKALTDHWKHYQEVELSVRAKRPMLVLPAIWVCASVFLHLLPHSHPIIYKSDCQMLCTFHHIVVDMVFFWTILYFPWYKLLTVKQTLYHICCSILGMVSVLGGQGKFHKI